MKILIAFITGMFLCALSTIAVTTVTGWDTGYVFTGIAVSSLLIPQMPGVAMMAITKNELVVAELLKQFDNMNDAFMSMIPTKNEAVKNDTIRFTDIGADPDVLIDNTVYPIATAGRVDDEIVVSLRKLDSTNTKLTDDELHALYYDKKSSVLERHKIALFKKYRNLSLHSLAPAGDTVNTPVIKTTGAVTGNRKKMTIADILKLRERAVALDIDLESMVLNLTGEHVTDLLETEQVFKEQYHHIQTGKILPLYGFQITENNFNNRYNIGTLSKVAFEAAAAGTDRNASTLIYSPNAVKARGSATKYERTAETDPENRETVVGFRLWALCVPVRNYGFGAVVSDTNV